MKMTASRLSLILVAMALVFALTSCGIFETTRDKIKYDNGTVPGGFGIDSDEVVFVEAAVCFTREMLAYGGYVGRQIMGVEFYNEAWGANRSVIVRLYSPAGEILREKSGMVGRGYHVINFD